MLISKNVIHFMLVVAVSLNSCAKKPIEPTPVQKKVEIPPEKQDLVHKVTYSGETLALIANWYTGKSSNWKLIKEANPKLIPERMNLGQVIIIPANLVIQHEPMPKKFLQSVGKKNSTNPTPESDIPAEIIKDVDNSGELTVSPTENKQQPATEIITQPTVPIEEKPAVEENKTDPQVTVPTNVPEVNEVIKNAPNKPNATDEEREKLLDELLSQ